MFRIPIRTNSVKSAYATQITGFKAQSSPERNLLPRILDILEKQYDLDKQHFEFLQQQESRRRADDAALNAFIKGAGSRGL